MACLYACCWVLFFLYAVRIKICALSQPQVSSPSSSCAVDCGAVCAVDVIDGIFRIGLYGLALWLSNSCAIGVIFVCFRIGLSSSSFGTGVDIFVVVFNGLNGRALLSSSSSSCAVDCGAVCVVDVIGGICRIGLYGLALWLLLSSACALFVSFFVVFVVISLLSASASALCAVDCGAGWAVSSSSTSLLICSENNS